MENIYKRKLAITQLLVYHGENKLHYNVMTMVSTLY